MLEVARAPTGSCIEDYQFRRIFTFLDPDADPLGAGYHITQAKIAMGSGGLAGRGYMQGTQSRLNFLPEKHTDFIFTTLAEEFGFVGTTTLLVLYALIVVFCIASAISNRDRFGALLTGGIATTFFLLFAVNMGMVMGLMPVVGVPLPLVSYGGIGDAGAARGLRPGAERPRPPPARPGLMGPRVALLGAAGALAALASAPARAPSPRRGSTSTLTDDPAGPWTFDYVIYRPGGPVDGLHALHPAEGGAEPLGRGRGDRRRPDADGAALPDGRRGTDPRHGRMGDRRTCCAITSGSTRTSSARTGSGGTGSCRRWRRTARVGLLGLGELGRAVAVALARPRLRPARAGAAGRANCRAWRAFAGEDGLEAVLRAVGDPGDAAAGDAGHREAARRAAAGAAAARARG